jgi:hypothetical protein
VESTDKPRALQCEETYAEFQWLALKTVLFLRGSLFYALQIKLNLFNKLARFVLTYNKHSNKKYITCASKHYKEAFRLER